MSKPSCVQKKLPVRSQQLLAFFRALSEANRWQILCLLQKGELCVCDLWRASALSQNLVSSHLRVLRELGLIVPRREGRNIYYSLNQDVFKKYQRELDIFFSKYQKN